jgi:anti-anti-sigma factor
MYPETDIAIIPLRDDLDVITVPSVRQSLERLMASGCRRIILNMAEVGFIDSAGMGLIMCEIARMRAAGGVMSLVNVAPTVMRALTLARVVDFAPVSDNKGAHEIPELDPRVLPLWRRVLRIDPSDLCVVRHRIDELLGRVALSDSERFDMTLAIGEAIGNAVDHTDGCGVLLALAGYPDRVVAEVSDCGCGFDGEIDVAARSAQSDECGCMEQATGEWNARGRGIKLMRLLVDSVTIAHKTSDTGTVVRIVKLVHHA